MSTPRRVVCPGESYVAGTRQFDQLSAQERHGKPPAPTTGLCFWCGQRVELERAVPVPHMVWVTIHGAWSPNAGVQP